MSMIITGLNFSESFTVMSIIVIINLPIRLYSITAEKNIILVSISTSIISYTIITLVLDLLRGKALKKTLLQQCIIVSCHHRWCRYLPCPGPALCPWTSAYAHWDISQHLLRAISTCWRAKTVHMMKLFFQNGICAWNLWNSHSPRQQMELAGHRSHPYCKRLHPTKNICMINLLTGLLGISMLWFVLSILLCLYFLNPHKRQYGAYKNYRQSQHYATSWHEYKLQEHFHLLRREAST